MTKRLPRSKLVFLFLIRTFNDIVAYYLIIVILDLTKVLLFFRLPIVFFYVNNININNKDFAILVIWLRILTIFSIFLLVSFSRLSISHGTKRLSIKQPKFLFIIIFKVRKLKRRSCFIFFRKSSILKTRYIYFWILKIDCKLVLNLALIMFLSISFNKSSS